MSEEVAERPEVVSDLRLEAHCPFELGKVARIQLTQANAKLAGPVWFVSWLPRPLSGAQLWGYAMYGNSDRIGHRADWNDRCYLHPLTGRLPGTQGGGNVKSAAVPFPEIRGFNYRVGDDALVSRCPATWSELSI